MLPKRLRRRRRGIHPVLATVILIAITLIAAIAIAGFVFGLFGSFTSSATISASTVNVKASLAAGTFAASCGTTAPASNYITAQNTGSGTASVTSIQITFGGKTATYAFTAGACPVVAGSTEYVTLSGLPAAPAASAGETFTGALALSNGGSAPYSGSFS